MYSFSSKAIPNPRRRRFSNTNRRSYSIGKHGGQPVARGSGIGTLHGSRKWQIGIVIRFPDEAAVRAWYNDPEYQKVLPLRDEAYGNDLEITMFQE